MGERQVDYEVKPLLDGVLYHAREIDPDFDAWTNKWVMSEKVRPVVPMNMPGADSDCFYWTCYEKNPITKSRTKLYVKFVQLQDMGAERKFVRKAKSGLLHRKEPQEFTSNAYNEWSANIISSDPEIEFRERINYYTPEGHIAMSRDLRSGQYLGAPDIERIDGNPDDYNDDWEDFVVPERAEMDFLRLDNTLKALGLQSLKH